MLAPHPSRSLAVALGAVVVGLCTGPTAWAHLIIPDQSNTSDLPTLMRNIQFFSPIGQEFTPTLHFLDAVELRTKDFAPFNGVGADLFINIRMDAITGPIVGTSVTISLPDNFGWPDPFHLPGEVTHFDFLSSVPLVPGNRYVLEIIVASGNAWGVGSNFGPYLGGDQISMGVPRPIGDLWFVEGPAAVIPEPGSFVLFALAVLGLAAYGCRRRPPRP